MFLNSKCEPLASAVVVQVKVFVGLLIADQEHYERYLNEFCRFLLEPYDNRSIN